MDSNYIKDRLKEPSTYASLAVAILGFAVAVGFINESQVTQLLAIASSVIAAVGAALPEGKKKTDE